MVIYNKRNNRQLVKNCKVARSFFSRFKGLMGKKQLPQGHGLLLSPCNSIHMFFMKFPIDAVFLDENNKVIHIQEGLMPWRMSKFVPKATSVLEIPTGTIKQSGTKTGDILVMEDG